MYSNCFISSYTLTCSAGIGLAAIRNSVRNNLSGLSDKGWPDSDVETWLGMVDQGSLNRIALTHKWLSRNNQLALLAMTQDNFLAAAREQISRFGPQRVGVILGTSTSSIGRTEEAYCHLSYTDEFTAEYMQPEINTPHSTGAFIANYLGITGPAITISTACSSSAKAFASGARWLEAGLVDSVIIGGVDTLCLSVIYGFNSLQLVSSEACKPFDQFRTGISLGEAGGFAILNKDSKNAQAALLGYGESTDAWHMSTPHPEGLGAKLSMQQALDRASCEAYDIDYVNLHGTGTRANDDIEGLACQTLFADALADTYVSATKGLTGHTLGAAGITEAILAIESIKTGIVPGTTNTTQPETVMREHLVLTSTEAAIGKAMSNSFGFGGNNCTLIFGDAGE
ncbi:MAG: beta-ketoacyl-ACP synthase [Gammaproteobacteria bacterium]|nr:beta-ketoacyl-ACP synthase [Gammaproteobacteria bacterium]